MATARPPARALLPAFSAGILNGAGFRSEQQRRHPAAVLAHQVLVGDHIEGVDQGFAWQALLESTVDPQHFQELRQGGLGFGRASIVGLAHKDWGELSLGRQFDQMNASLIRFSPNVTAGVYSATVGDADRVAGNWLNNMVTYKTPVWGGLQLAGQYSFKEDGTSSTHGRRAPNQGRPRCCEPIAWAPPTATVRSPQARR